MSLESATTINQLVPTNPDGSDPKGQGDDHLRLIKSTLLNTFPGITGPVTATQSDLNALVGGNAVFKRAMILMWAGNLSNIPAGWLLCNGTAATPDLTDRFVVGAGGSYAPHSAGGTATHTHGITVGGTALSTAQIPPHDHLVGVGPWTPDGIDTSGDVREPRNVIDYPGTYANLHTSAVGSGAAHDHPASAAVVDHRPPYYALAFIMKE